MNKDIVLNGKNSVLQLICQQKADKVQYEELSFSNLDNGKKISIKLGYRRCKNFDETNSAGHDFAIIQADQEYVVGLVADGVSQSFFGNIAAEFISKRFIQILWNNRQQPLNHKQTENFLKSIQKEAFAEVNHFVIPQHLSPALQQILEDVRRKEGSKAVFTSFLLDVASRTAYLYKVGDVVAFVQLENGNLLPVESDPTGCWSSLGQNSLKLHTEIVNLAKGILLKSDGVKGLLGEVFDEEQTAETKFIDLAENGSIDDDISFVAVCLNQNNDIQQYIKMPNHLLQKQPNQTYLQLDVPSLKEEVTVHTIPEIEKEVTAQNQKLVQPTKRSIPKLPDTGNISTFSKSNQSGKNAMLSKLIDSKLVLYTVPFLMGILLCLVVLNNGFSYSRKYEEKSSPKITPPPVEPTPMITPPPRPTTKTGVASENANKVDVSTVAGGPVANPDQLVIGKNGIPKAGSNTDSANENKDNISSDKILTSGLGANSTNENKNNANNKISKTEGSGYTEVNSDENGRLKFTGRGNLGESSHQETSSSNTSNSVKLNSHEKIVNGRKVPCLETDPK